MSHHSPRCHSGMMGAHERRGVQQNPQGRFPPAHPSILHEEIQRLSSLLEMERAGRSDDNQKLAHLEAELEETKLQLKRQKALKEMYINKGKETKKELERVEKFSDPEVLKAAAMASRIHNDVKYKKKKPLQEDFVELKVAHLLSQEAFVAEIQAERAKSKALQADLDSLLASYEELRSKCEADAALGRQDAETQAKCSEFEGTRGHRGDGGAGRGPDERRAAPVGRSGAAPPVIIRVTAARPRLCAACTRRDVLPRERSEHLSVPPRGQPPPTSLSNSTQLFLCQVHGHFPQRGGPELAPGPRV
ncbi:uncharacterized protein LOC103458794 [Poecilia reticulata]|uniref:uncharacterized protein LOC103458794 n=1 Tax=Poecilia reticulata TaxID=8081 RepID=UPI0004A475A6|nr:PREDICTED: uncharacterized protein LOC103458794 [Poecilia reticulata]